MTQPCSRLRLCDDRTLVAHHRIVEPGLERVPPDRLEHAAGHEHDVDVRATHAGQRVARPRRQASILADQRPVEVARDRLNVAREVRRELD